MTPLFIIMLMFVHTSYAETALDTWTNIIEPTTRLTSWWATGWQYFTTPQHIAQVGASIGATAGNKNSDGYIELSLPAGSRGIVIGNLGSSPQTLLHICKALARDNILTPELALTAPHDIIICLGALAGSSSMHDPELGLMSALATANPGRVFVCPPLSICARWRVNEAMYRWCQQLPTGVLITNGDTSPRDTSGAGILCTPYHEQLSKRLSGATVVNHGVGDHKVAGHGVAGHKVAITTPDGTNPRLHRQGLAWFTMPGGIENWSIISAPTAENKQIYGTQNEAFGIITVNDQHYTQAPGAATLSWYVGNDQELPHKTETIQLTFDAAHTIRIGGINDLSRANRVEGQGEVDGFLLRINEFTRDTTHPYAIRYIAYDDQYDPRLTQKYLTELCTQDNIAALAMVGGTSPLRSITGAIHERGKKLFFPGSGAAEFRKADLVDLIHAKASYDDEVRVLFTYLIEKKQSKQIACVYQSDGFGPPMLAIARETCAKYPHVKLIEIPYHAESIDMKEPIATFMASGADTICFLATTFAARAFIQQIDIAALLRLVCATTSGFWEPAFREFLRTKGLRMISSEVVPDPRTSTIPVVARYRQAMDAQQAPYSTATLEGYMMAHILLDILNKIPQQQWLDPALGNLIMQQLEQLNNYACDGLTLTFDPQTRTLSHAIWIADSDAPWQLITP